MPRQVDLDGLRRLMEQGAQVVDALPAREYGEDHIPGAINLPWKTLVEANNSHKLKPAAELRAAYAQIGIKESDDIIVYCGTSREASLEYFVLKHILKFPKVRLYEGSWAEYSNHAALPIETGGAKIAE